jgi:hypothetical protein
MAGRMISGAAALAELVRAAGEHDAPGVHRVLPVAPELSGLLPGRGLRRGTTVAVSAGRAAPAAGSTSLLLALLAEASRAGSWCAVVGLPSLGALAAQESGIDLERLALVPDPGPDWPTVIAALIDGVDVVVTAIQGKVAPTVADRLVARARQRGSVLMPFGQWPGADVTLQVTASRWEGLALGRGRLRRREVTILARGRGAAARPKEITLWMPGLTHLPPATPHSTAPSTTTQSPQPTPTNSPTRTLRAVPPASAHSRQRPAAKRPVAKWPVAKWPVAKRASSELPAAETSVRALTHISPASGHSSGPFAVGPFAVGPSAVGPSAVGPSAVGPSVGGPSAVANSAHGATPVSPAFGRPFQPPSAESRIQIQSQSRIRDLTLVRSGSVGFPQLSTGPVQGSTAPHPGGNVRRPWMPAKKRQKQADQKPSGQDQDQGQDQGLAATA